MKIWMMRVFVLLLRILYAPMKCRKTQNKIVWLSRQSDEKSADMTLLSRAVEELCPDTAQVFRLRRLKDEAGVSPAYVGSLIRDMWELASAHTAVTDTYSVALSCLTHKKSLRIIQIWHASGAVKKFGLQSVGKAQGRDAAVAKAMCMHKNYDVVIAPSRSAATFFCQGFGCSPERIRIACLPRVDLILDGQSRREAFLQQNPEYREKKLLVYLPTFRQNDREYIRQLAAAFENFPAYALLVSPHPLSRAAGDAAYGFRGDFSTYDLMKLADGVITDYSACGIEASLLDKPLWFYVPDYEDYRREQGLNIDLEAELGSACFRSAGDLAAAVASGRYDWQALRAFSERYVEHRTTGNTAYLAQIICEGKEST